MVAQDPRLLVAQNPLHSMAYEERKRNIYMWEIFMAKLEREVHHFHLHPIGLKNTAIGKLNLGDK